MSIVFRKPITEDAISIHKLVEQSQTLDKNSLYCNLIQCEHFRDTCAVAELDSKLVGFLTAYLIPSRKNTLFIWQVAVCPSTRQQGVASRLFDYVLTQIPARSIQFLEATITEDNTASWRLFESLALRWKSPISRHLLFQKNKHFAGQHATEILAKIGPFSG